MRHICTAIVATLALAGTSFAQSEAIAWGGNYWGQCDIPAGETFVQVAGGDNHTLGLRADGTAGVLEQPGERMSALRVSRRSKHPMTRPVFSLRTIPFGVCMRCFHYVRTPL